MTDNSNVINSILDKLGLIEIELGLLKSNIILDGADSPPTHRITRYDGPLVGWHEKYVDGELWVASRTNPGTWYNYEVAEKQAKATASYIRDYGYVWATDLTDFFRQADHFKTTYLPIVRVLANLEKHTHGWQGRTYYCLRGQLVEPTVEKKESPGNPEFSAVDVLRQIVASANGSGITWPEIRRKASGWDQDSLQGAMVTLISEKQIDFRVEDNGGVTFLIK